MRLLGRKLPQPLSHPKAMFSRPLNQGQHGFRSIPLSFD